MSKYLEAFHAVQHGGYNIITEEIQKHTT